ncbi:hypothetical protein PM082_021593, partial [Marasmius tenuissimus]
AINPPVSFTIRTSTTSIQKHFFGDHPDTWIPTCDQEGITITSDEYSLKANEWQAKNNIPLPKEPRKMFTTQLFHQFLIDLVIHEDPPLRIVGSEAFRRLILLLCNAMEEKNIPHCTSLQKMVFQEWVRLMHQLKAHLQGSLGRISFTTDGWSDGTVFPFIAVTAHWVEQVEIRPLPLPDPSQPPIPQPPTVEAEVLPTQWQHGTD